MYSLSLGHRHLSLIQPPLKSGPYVCGNLLHGNFCGGYRPSWADGGDCGTAQWRVASLKNWSNWLYTGSGTG